MVIGRWRLVNWHFPSLGQRGPYRPGTLHGRLTEAAQTGPVPASTNIEERATTSPGTEPSPRGTARVDPPVNFGSATRRYTGALSQVARRNVWSPDGYRKVVHPTRHKRIGLRRCRVRLAVAQVRLSGEQVVQGCLHGVVVQVGVVEREVRGVCQASPSGGKGL
jgi:hypothetical protein